jgi:hypothetical protein
MKYGETLRQRSVPQWAYRKWLEASLKHDLPCLENIDYNSIKKLIKEHTTPSKVKAISIPGQGDEVESNSEDTLFGILKDEHDRVGLFVRSKAGEIDRRLGMDYLFLS